jgi:hypothetical protein
MKIPLLRSLSRHGYDASSPQYSFALPSRRTNASNASSVASFESVVVDDDAVGLPVVSIASREEIVATSVSWKIEASVVANDAVAASLVRTEWC